MTRKSYLAWSCWLVSCTSVAADFNQQFSIINDNSWLSGFEDQASQASRALFTWDWQLEAGPQWLVAGNLKAFRGRNGELLTGNVQGISNIDAEHFSKIYELYLQYKFDDETRLKCGQVDANLEFAFVPVAGGFISPPLGITPTAIALPTYYDPAASCSVFYEPEHGFQWMTGLFAGQDHTNFSSQFMVAEGRYVSAQSRTSYGYWHHHGDWTTLNEQQLRAISGWYLNHQQQVSDELTLFAVWSGLNDDVDILHQHRMLGLVWELPVAGHQLGLMHSTVTAQDRQSEQMIEGYWQWSLTPQIQLQPVLQWIHHIDPALDHSLVATLRLMAQF